MKELVNKILNQLSELPDFVGIALGEVNTKGNFGNTPLHVVAVQGDLEAAQLLLRAGADVNAEGDEGYTPLHDAVEQSNYEMVALLLKAGADRLRVTRTGLSAADIASTTRDPDRMYSLLRI